VDWLLGAPREKLVVVLMRSLRMAKGKAQTRSSEVRKHQDQHEYINGDRTHVPDHLAYPFGLAVGLIKILHWDAL
jgi:hypothetical protein